MFDLIGKSLGRYHILEQLPMGGMSFVYKAHDTRLEMNVAVKVIRTDNILPNALERSQRRFEREVKALARLTHPNIVKVMDYGEYEGKPYFVMPYLPGGTLKQQLKGKPVPWEDAVRLLIPIARALHYAHQQGFIHRDVKPSNILITQSGEPMLTDFGIAKIIDEETSRDLTIPGMVVGTPEYMAPEQATAEPIDHRVDVYSLGVVFYEMVTGWLPFVANTRVAVLFKHISEPLPNPKKFVPDLPDCMMEVLLTALAKQRESRYKNMAEMAMAWQNALESTKGGKQPLSILDSARVNDNFMEPIPIEESPGPEPVPEEEEKPHPARIEIIGKGELSVPIAGVQMVFVCVMTGSFVMGSSKGEGNEDERPRHEVYLDEYWMGKTPVTNLQYQAFVKATGRTPPSHWEGNLIPTGREQHPVIRVSWQDAQVFCDWASRVSGHKIRLPTEAEWEKAARGADGRIYPWGYQKPTRQLCNCLKRFSATTTPVGQFSPQGDSPFGCADMVGNVWEWMADWYVEDYYANSSSNNPQGPTSGECRVLRGGSWFNDEASVRVANRLKSNPFTSTHVVGFRCALSP